MRYFIVLFKGVNPKYGEGYVWQAGEYFDTLSEERALMFYPRVFSEDTDRQVVKISEITEAEYNDIKHKVK